MPLIEEQFPGAEMALLRACEAVEEELAWTEPLVERTAAGFAVKGDDGQVDMHLEGLEELPVGLLHRVLMKALEEIRGNLDAIGREHIERLANWR